MIFSDKLRIIRKSKGITQEELAEKLQVSRQAVTKWESGQAYPDIINLIQISKLFNITVDYLVKDSECLKSPMLKPNNEWNEIIEFRVEAGRNTYAGYGKQVDPSRPQSHDYRYEQGDLLYIDTYIGGECFSGEEAIWKKNVPVWAMNYSGRVLKEEFSGDFLKEALRNCNEQQPYRGPEYYQDGEYTYKMQITGDMNWFQGYEEIFFKNEKVYECYFHGGIVK
jgi:transcriptional regulator with XRE-family HTH domain